MGALKAIVRGFSYLYHAILALFLIGVSGLALAVAPQSLHLDMLPWTGSTLTYVIFFGALFGLISVVLAFAGKLRVLFFLWALIVVVLMIRGFFFSGFRFDPGAGGVRTAAWLAVGALIALVGAWSAMMLPSSERRY